MANPEAHQVNIFTNVVHIDNQVLFISEENEIFRKNELG